MVDYRQTGLGEALVVLVERLSWGPLGVSADDGVRGVSLDLVATRVLVLTGSSELRGGVDPVESDLRVLTGVVVESTVGRRGVAVGAAFEPDSR